jgi:hypothetical protein
MKHLKYFESNDEKNKKILFLIFIIDGRIDIGDKDRCFKTLEV